MFSKLIEKLTGKDDVERVMAKKSMNLLMEYLKTRKLMIPRRPRKYLDAANLDQDELLKLIESESKSLREDLDGDRFEPWILEVEGKRRLPVFSSQKTMEVFSAEVSKSLNKVFALGFVDMLVDDLLKWPDLDVIDLNYFSEGSMEISVHRPSN